MKRTKLLTALLLFSTALSCLSEQVDVAAYLLSLKNKTDQSEAHVLNSDIHVTPQDRLDWDTAFGWGDHAGLYKGILWFPSWTEVTDKPDLSVYQLAAYWPPNATASSWFTYTTNANEITITGYNFAGGTDVIIPDYINGLPVTAIGYNAFSPEGFGVAIESISGGGNVITLGDSAFYNCIYLVSITLPQVSVIGDSAFYNCTSLTSLTIPNSVTSIGNYAFSDCSSLTSITIGNSVTSIGDEAFYSCYSLTSLYFDGNAPTIGFEIFNLLPENQVTNYVTNPTATGWGDELGDMPVVRLDLHTKKLTAGSIELGGVEKDAWPEPDLSIIAPLIASGTNITVTSTQSVYSVAVMGAGTVGIDWSGLALDGTGRAEVILRLNVTDWGGTNITFSPSLTFDTSPEILVTGVWEFAASTIDGVTTRVRQTWPETDEWTTATYAHASGGWVASLQRMSVNNTSTNSLTCVCPLAPLLLICPLMTVNASKPVSFSYGFSAIPSPTTSVPTVLYGPFSAYHGYRVDGAIHAVENPSRYGLVQIWVGNSSPEEVADVFVYPGRTFIRPANANERAAYEAGWRP